MALEDQYLTAIRGFEGYTPRAQWDYKQHSVGYGSKALSPDEQLDEPTARARHAQDIATAEGTVNQAFPNLPGMTPGRLAALTSLTQNTGTKWINDGLGDAIRRGDWNDAASRFTQYTKAGGVHNEGLANRRNQEVAWFDGNEAPIAMAMQQERKTPMAYEDQQPPQPALAPAAALGGPGALFGGDFMNRLERAGAYLRDDPRVAASVAKAAPEYSVHEGKDGTMWRLDKRSGTLTPVQPSGGARPTTPGQKKVDEDYAKDYSDWTQGGYAETTKALTQLGEAHKSLAANKGLTGPIVGNLPDTLLGQYSPDTARVRDQIYDTAQRSMKGILGAQFTEKEGAGILARAFNPVLNDQENARRVGALMTSLQEAAKAKHEAATYFQKNGTLTGYKGRLPADAFSAGGGSAKPTSGGSGERPPLSSFAR